MANNAKPKAKIINIALMMRPQPPPQPPPQPAFHQPTPQPHGVLLLRVLLGLLFWAHLYWKFFVLPGGLHQWWGSFSTNGYPWFVPWYAISAELVGALLLIPGIYARWASLYAVPLMIGAAQFWLVRKGFFFTSAGCELPIVWTILLVVQALLGDGPYALKPSPLPGIYSSQRAPA